MMFKKALILVGFLSGHVFASSSIDELKETKRFFPAQFSTDSLYELIDKKETVVDFKIFSISDKDQKKLEAYSPYRMQVLTGSSFPQRVKKISEDIKQLSAEYELAGAYYGTDKITVKGAYNVLQLFIPGEILSENALCLHRLRDLGQDFSAQTSCSYRLNPILARLFYFCKLIELPQEKRTLYHTANQDEYSSIGHNLLADYMGIKGFSPEDRIKVTEQKEISLDKDFYKNTFAYIKSKIYTKLDIDEKILETMYEGDGLFNIMEKYNEAVRRAYNESHADSSSQNI